MQGGIKGAGWLPASLLLMAISVFGFVCILATSRKMYQNR